MSNDVINSDLLTRIFKVCGNEDMATEVLHCLIENVTVRESYLKQVLKVNVEDSSDTDNISTQHANEESKGVPDLRIETENSLIIVENKLGAGLTDNQPVEYVKELLRSEKPIKQLILQVPNKRLVAVKKEVTRRIISEQDLCLVKVISWEDTVEWLKTADLPDTPVFSYLRQSALLLFQKMLTGFFQQIRLPITEDDVDILLSKGHARATVALIDLLQSVVEELKSVGWNVSAKSVSFEFSGIYFQRENGLKYWIGTFPRATHIEEKGLLWFQVPKSDDEVLGKLSQAGFEAIIAEKFGWGGIIVPLKGPADAESSEKQAKEIVENIETAINAIEGEKAK